MDQSGRCGVCDLTGPLLEIQQHFENEHMDQEQDQDTLRGPPSPVVCAPTNEGMRWTSHNVLLLIRLMEANAEKFNTTMKKNVWIQIAKQISDIAGQTITHEQVDSKWKGLKKTYKKIKDHNNKSGNGTAKWEFFNAMDSFLSRKPEITPLAVCDTTTGLTINEVPITQPSQAQPMSSGSSFTKTRKRIASEVQKRHDEKMTRYDEFLALFRKSVEHEIGKKAE